MASFANEANQQGVHTFHGLSLHLKWNENQMWKVNQRVLSRTEPEFGLGIIESVSDAGTVKVYFPLSDTSRQYGQRNAPLHRFIFNVGDKIETLKGEVVVVTDVKQESGLIQYSSSEVTIFEWEVSARLQDPGALQRLLQGHWSTARAFDLRCESWRLKGRGSGTEVFGLIAPRVNPIPHQLFITRSVIERNKPRAVLADEVGLGKTIEAGLILSALRAQGRATRVLVVVPEALVFQWVEEMYRRFHLLFSVVDAERNKNEKQAMQVSGFSANQLVVTSMNALSSDADMIKDACADSWDLVIFDEAHHFRWSEEKPHVNWLIAKRISENSKGALLLTATPRQYGLDTQFGLFQIADPDRFNDFDAFLDEAEYDSKIAEIAKKASLNGWSKSLKSDVEKLFPGDDTLFLDANSKSESKEDQIHFLLRKLSERHSFGGIVYRNRRSNLQGFPKRVLHAHPIESDGEYIKTMHSLDPKELSEMGLMDIATGRGSSRVEPLEGLVDPKLKWIVKFVRDLGKSEKALILCANIEKVETIAFFLSSFDEIKYAIFHEDLSVLDRDKQAASFADPDGANVLICSEIGGEGRNFQFAHKLVLGDLPRHPDLVEQRIGRLDRIGQKRNIEVHVPYLAETPEEVLFQWFDAGLNSFESSWNGTDIFLQEFAEDIFECFDAFMPKGENYSKRHKILDNLITETKLFAENVRKENEANVDVLLDINSFDQERGDNLLDQIENCDDDPELEFYFRNVLDFYGIDYDEYDDRGTLSVKGDSLKFIQKFPGLKEDEDTLFTFDRELGLVREDITFLTLDHPVTEAVLSMFMERNEGVASVCTWPNSPMGQGILLEVAVVMQAQGPKDLELERFLPTIVNQLIIDHLGNIKDGLEIPTDKMKDMKASQAQIDPASLQDRLEPLIEKAYQTCQSECDELRTNAVQKAKKHYQAVIQKLEYLSRVNPNIDEEELDYWRARSEETLQSLESAKLRFDALRLVFTS